MLFRVPTPPSPTPEATRRILRPGEPSPAERNRLISEELFRDALVRERKRADRFEESFVLVRITLDRRGLDMSSLGRITNAMAKFQSEGDVVGWFQGDSVLGLIRSIPDLDPGNTAAALGVAFRRELAECLTPAQRRCCWIRCETYSPRNEVIAPVTFDAADLRQGARHRASVAAKRALDIVGSTVGLILFGPVFLCVAAAVKLTSNGPVLFKQQRVGEGGRSFKMLKFRTMHVNADHRIHQEYVEGFIQSSNGATSGSDAVFKLSNDPRVTPVGDFLRRSSLDELPQLWNVLRGEMSLVGPRPPLPYEVARYKRWHRRRILEAKPGMTGLWQVTGRSRTTFDDMVRLDLHYAANCSISNDLKILLATPRAVLSGKGAR